MKVKSLDVLHQGDNSAENIDLGTRNSVVTKENMVNDEVPVGLVQDDGSESGIQQHGSDLADAICAMVTVSGQVNQDIASTEPESNVNHANVSHFPMFHSHS